MGPVLLDKSSTFTDLISEAKLVMVNNTAHLLTSNNARTALVSHAHARNIPLMSETSSRINLLEKHIDTVFGHSQLGDRVKFGHNWWSLKQN